MMRVIRNNVYKSTKRSAYPLPICHTSNWNLRSRSMCKATLSNEQIDFGLRHEFMDSVVCYGPQDYKYEKRKIPVDLKPNEVLMNVTRVGICAGDTKCYLGAPLFWGHNEFGEPYCQSGVVAGHEFIGDVVALGDDASRLYGLSIGDQAIAEQIVPCNECELCLSGDYNLCNPWNGRYRSPHNIYGFRTACNGGMANYMKYVDNSRIHVVPKEISAAHAVYIEPLSCGIHAANRADIQLNDVVVVSGAGAIGLGAICAAKLKSPKKIIALDLDDDKLAIARKCGADEGWNPSKMDVVKSIMEITDFYGCHKYIEAAGSPQSVVQGLEMLRRKGVMVEYSVFKEDVMVNMTKISDEKEINLRGGHLGPNCYPTAIRLLKDGVVPVEDIVTHCYPMSEFMKGFATVDRSIVPPKGFNVDQFSIKVTLDPSK
eukprot:88501_1